MISTFLVFILIGMIAGPLFALMGPFLKWLLAKPNDHWIPNPRLMKVTTTTMLKNYAILRRLYDKSFARVETKKLMPLRLKPKRLYTILVGWSVPIDLDLSISSFPEALRMAAELKENYPNNMFLPMWKDRAQLRYDKALDINWNLNDLNVLSIDGLGGELSKRKKQLTFKHS
jgi:hypothetical protein